MHTKGVTKTKEKNISSDIKSFLQSVETVTHIDEREPNRQLFDLGLVITDRDSTSVIKNVASAFPAGRAKTFVLNNKYDSELYTAALLEANREGQWLVVNCLADPAPEVIQTIQQMSEANTFTLTNVGDKGLVKITLNPKTRLVFCITSTFLETGISYPYFLNLFGVVLRLP